MASNKELDALFAQQSFDLPKFYGRGYIPSHYKRLTCTREEADRLAEIGFTEIMTYYGESTYYTQAIIAGALLSGDYDWITVVTPSAYGKLIADDEPVLTRSGWKSHGELVVGDEVIAPNGDFVKVTYVHPKGIANRIVKFADGSEVKCHENHLWAVDYRNSKTNEHSVKVRSVAEMEQHGVVKGGKCEAGRSKYYVIKREAVKGEHKDLAVPPYVMGVWLGDGSTTKGQITFDADDRAVFDKCREYYPDGSEWVHKETGVHTGSLIGLAGDLTAYNMCFQRKDTPRKHIPEEYLTASIEQRLELLAGLIDTDGYVDKERRDHARVVFTTCNAELKDSVEELVSTFGWRVSTTVIPPYTSTSGIAGKRDTYVTSFSPDMTIPCVLPRKRFTEEQLARKRGIGITAIEPIEPVQGNCITVEGGLYCVGKHMLPTHNSWLFGRIGNIMAYKGEPTYVVAATQDGTKMIMGHVGQSLQNIAPEVRNELLNKKDQIERLTTSLSKQKIAFANGGFIEPITTGDTYDENIAQNKVVGKPGNYLIDEAALVSDQSFGELGRAEFARVDGRNYMRAMISNPHQPGFFYSELTKPAEEVGKREIIIWMDALTAVEEGRLTKEKVYKGTFAKHRSQLRRYLLCVLDDDGEGMFIMPDKYEAPVQGEYLQYFMGVDAAYKGKDNIEVSITAVGNGKIWVERTIKIEKKRWIEGVTPKDIIKQIVRIAREYDVALCCVDVGWGVWLTEGLRDRHVNVIGINFQASPTEKRRKNKEYCATNALNKRAEMHLDFQDLTDNGVLVISEEVAEKIKDTLPYISSERRASGKVQIRQKEEIKAIIGRSPDEFDSVLLSIHAAVLFYENTTIALD